MYFKNCKEAKAKGYKNIKRGQPGYRPKLDRDKDGIACESK
ncbi:calcium-binding protein [Leptotrichia sp. oral taxon 847]|nr:calcium-binding protein [Leptotrichia sp. oral taxon 847]